MGDVESFWLDRYGRNMEFLIFSRVNSSGWPAIPETSYMIGVTTLSAIALIVGVVRLVLRFRSRRVLDLDDALFSFALLCGVVSAFFIIYSRDFFYTEARIRLGDAMFANLTDIVPGFNLYLQIMNGVSAAAWASIYSVKFCYLMFFDRLTRRITHIRIWWWIVLCFTISSCLVTCFLSFSVCSDIGPDVLAKCSIPAMNGRAATWNILSGCLDVLTDSTIISIPFLLLRKLNIDIKRKFAAGAILSLSAVMIGVALVRMFPPTMKVLPIDGTWFFFWINVESSVAIIMVSITAFRSIYQAGRPPASSGYGRKSSNFFSKVRHSLFPPRDRLPVSGEGQEGIQKHRVPGIELKGYHRPWNGINDKEHGHKALGHSANVTTNINITSVSVSRDMESDSSARITKVSDITLSRHSIGGTSIRSDEPSYKAARR